MRSKKIELRDPLFICWLSHFPNKKPCNYVFSFSHPQSFLIFFFVYTSSSSSVPPIWSCWRSFIKVLPSTPLARLSTISTCKLNSVVCSCLSKCLQIVQPSNITRSHKPKLEDTFIWERSDVLFHTWRLFDNWRTS